MDLEQYLGKKIRVIFIDGQVLEGVCNTFTNKFDTEDELYDEITIKTDSHPYVSFNESEVESIEVLHGERWLRGYCLPSIGLFI